MEPQLEALFRFADNRAKNREPPTVIEPARQLRSFKFNCRSRGLKHKTIQDYAHRLAYLVNYADHINRPLSDLTTNDIREYVAQIIDTGLSPVTINGRLRVWSLFWNYCLEEAFMDKSNPMGRVKRLREEIQIKPTLTMRELDLLLNSFDRRTFIGARNRTMTLTIIDTCVRIGELVRLTINDVNLDDQVAIIRHTKSYKDRPVPLSPTIVQAIYNYRIKWRDRLPGDRLFCYLNGDPMKVDRFRKILVAKRKQLGLEVLGPHLLRRTGARYLHEAGMSPELIRRLLGHTDIRTTQRYIADNQFGTVKDHHARYSVVGRLGIR